MKSTHSEIRVAEKSATEKTYKCGHAGPTWFLLDMYGHVTKRLENREECPSCLIQMLFQNTIHCGLCGHIILPGDGVALYDVTLNNLEFAEVGTFIDDNTVLGCMRWDCCPSGGFFGGNWSEKGFIPRFQHGTAMQETITTGESIILSKI